MHHNFLALAITLTATCAAVGQTIQAPFAGIYGYTDLGAVPGVPASYGGVTWKRNDPNTMLIGGSANGSAGAIYEVGVLRDSTGRITGWAGPATLFASAPYIDGGLTYGPGGVLFYTTYSNNTLGQIKPGSTVADRIDALTPLGVTSSTGTVTFVPNGFANAGEMKIASYNSGQFYGFTIAPDGNGTFAIAPSNGPVQIGGGPEGILYVPPGSSLLSNYQYMLVTEYSTGTVVLYQVDGQSNPVPSSRLPFMTGLSGAEGACTDPVTGALVFSTFGGGSRVVMVEGFGVCGSFQAYGTGIPGQHGAPSISGSGCAGRGHVTSIDIGNGPGNAAGLLAVGFLQQNVPMLNGSLLVNPIATFFHFLNGQGQFALQVFLPVDPVMTGLNIFAQSFYVDAAAAAGVSATGGLHLLVR